MDSSPAGHVKTDRTLVTYSVYLRYTAGEQSVYHNYLGK
jgi:hypothetical protein